MHSIHKFFKPQPPPKRKATDIPDERKQKEAKKLVPKFVDNELKLSELLSDDWLEAVGPLLQKQPEAKRFLGTDRPWTIPKRAQTFSALEGVAPQDIRVVVFGQDPYPRAASAVGIAFCDGQVQDWSKRLSPSLRNIVKNVFVSRGELDPRANVQDVRKAITKCRLVDPQTWFQHTRAQGVLWLNTSLTFSSKKKEDLDKHAAFWRPIVLGIVEAVIDAKGRTRSQHGPPGLVFVFWGDYAKSLKKDIQTIAERLQTKVGLRFVSSKHPAVEAFHQSKVFRRIDKEVEGLGLGKIHWVKKRPHDETKSDTVCKPADAPLNKPNNNPEDPAQTQAPTT